KKLPPTHVAACGAGLRKEGRSVRFGTGIPAIGFGAEPAAIEAIATFAEELGYDSLWNGDHIVLPTRAASQYPYTSSAAFLLPDRRTPFYDAVGLLGYRAGITKRIRLGVGVLVLPYRNAVVTAKELATIDNLSRGRIVLGVGTGWMAEEFEALCTPERFFPER